MAATDILKAVEDGANAAVIQNAVLTGRIPLPIVLSPETLAQMLRGAIVGAPALPEDFA